MHVPPWFVFVLHNNLIWGKLAEYIIYQTQSETDNSGADKCDTFAICKKFLSFFTLNKSLDLVFTKQQHCL